MEIFAKIDFWGLKCPHEVLVGLKTCSAICGTHVQTILNHKDLTGSAAGVREGQSAVQYGANGGNFGPYFDLTTPPYLLAPGKKREKHSKLTLRLLQSTFL